MMKKILSIIVFFAFIFILTGCNNNSKDNKSYENKNNGIVMNVIESTLTKTKATFILRNDSENVYEYGNPYSLEKYEENEWKELESINQLSFTLPAFQLNPKEKKEIIVDWEYHYGELKPGLYRLVKDVIIQEKDDETHNEYNKFYIYAEFKIK